MIKKDYISQNMYTGSLYVTPPVHIEPACSISYTLIRRYNGVNNEEVINVLYSNCECK